MGVCANDAQKVYVKKKKNQLIIIRRLKANITKPFAPPSKLEAYVYQKKRLKTIFAPFIKACTDIEDLVVLYQIFFLSRQKVRNNKLRTGLPKWWRINTIMISSVSEPSWKDANSVFDPVGTCNDAGSTRD